MLPTRLSRQPAFLAIITLVFIGLLGCGPIIIRFQEAIPTPSVAYVQLAADIGLSFFYAYALLYALAMQRYVFMAALPLLFVVSAAANDFILHYSMNVTEDIIGVVIESTGEEMHAYANPYLAFYILAALTAAAFCIYLYRKGTKLPADSKRGFIFIIFVLMVIFGDDGGTGQQYIPFNIIKNVYRYTSDHYGSHKKRDLSKEHYIWENKDKDVTVVLVIGESSRADHWSLNGYRRETNPLLEKQKDLVSFPDVTSCTALTRSAVPCMLTRKTLKDAENQGISLHVDETSLVSVFRAMGFDTYWVGVQGTHAFTDSPFLSIMEEANRHVLLNPYLSMNGRLDAEAFPYADEFLARPGHLKLLIIHTMGNHWPYTHRYPKEFEKFKPVCGESSIYKNTFALQSAMKECDQVPHALINSYDNSILYVDYFLSALIDKLKRRNAFLLYASDHGQSLGENGIYLHGNMNVKVQRHIPMISWASEEFIKKHPAVWNNVLAHRDAKLSHDYVFHSLLDCVGLRSNIIDPKLSLCASAAH